MGLDGFDGFGDAFDDFFNEEEFKQNAILISSKKIEIDGEVYLEEVWEYDGMTVTKTTIDRVIESPDDLSDIETIDKFDEEHLESFYANIKEKLEFLRMDLEEAVDKEDYKSAASIKKQIDSITDLLKKKYKK